jgi:hypothetical protein
MSDLRFKEATRRRKKHKEMITRKNWNMIREEEEHKSDGRQHIRGGGSGGGRVDGDSPPLGLPLYWGE